MDQRSTKRNRTFLDGRIIFNNRCSVINCTVRDLSDNGARILFGHTIQVPEEFELEIPKKKLSVSARVMWSNGKEHGVKFVTGLHHPTPSEAPQGPEVARPQDSTMSEQTAPDSAIIQKILDDAQRQIAQAMGTSADTVRLKLEIDLVRAGVQRH